MKPKEKVCALCKKAETSPKDKNPVLLSFWDSKNDQYVCACCNRGLESLNDIGKSKIKIIDLLSDDSEKDEDKDY